MKWTSAFICLALAACGATPPPPEPSLEALLARERAQREQRRGQVDALIPRQGPRQAAELHQVAQIYKLPQRVAEALPPADGVSALSLQLLIHPDGSVSDCLHQGPAPSRAWVALCAHVKRMHFGAKTDQSTPVRLLLNLQATP